MVILSGDLFHAGPAWTDVPTAFSFTAGTIENHVHFVNERYRIPDGIRYLPDFRPGLLEQSFTIQGDLDVVMDVVDGKSCAIEIASTAAPASPRTLDEPDLGSLGALPKQADRATCTKRAARMLRKISRKVFTAFLVS